MNGELSLWSAVKYVWLAFAGLALWVAKRHLAEDEKVAARVAALEQTCATRDDVQALRESLEEGQRQILGALLNK